MNTWEKLNGLLGSEGFLQTKNKNVYLHRTKDGAVRVHYHATDVINAFPNGDVVLDTGGGRTVTTKRRLNEFSLVSVYQDKKQWYFEYNGKRYEWPNNSDKIHIYEQSKRVMYQPWPTRGMAELKPIGE